MELIARLWVATHAETMEHLSEHVEGTLRGREARRVLRHLARCPMCRGALRSLARTVEALRSLGRADQLVPDAPSVAAPVAERIRREAAPP